MVDLRKRRKRACQRIINNEEEEFDPEEPDPPLRDADDIEYGSDPNGDDVEVAVIGGGTNSGDFKAMTVFNCNWKTEVCTKSSKSMANIFGNGRYAVGCGQM